jgi:hypothetical protein
MQNHRTTHAVELLARRVLKRGERGMTTSEYAVGTVGACGVAGVLYELTQTDFFQDLMKSVITELTSILPF